MQMDVKPQTGKFQTNVSLPCTLNSQYHIAFLLQITSSACGTVPPLRLLFKLFMVYVCCSYSVKQYFEENSTHKICDELFILPSITVIMWLHYFSTN